MGLAAKAFWIAVTIAGAAQAAVHRLGASSNGTAIEELTCCVGKGSMELKGVDRGAHFDIFWWGVCGSYIRERPWLIGHCTYGDIFNAEATSYEEDKCIRKEETDEFDKFVVGVEEKYERELKKIDYDEFTRTRVRAEFRALVGVAFWFRHFVLPPKNEESFLYGWTWIGEPEATNRDWRLPKEFATEKFKEACEEFASAKYTEPKCGVLPPMVRDACNTQGVKYQDINEAREARVKMNEGQEEKPYTELNTQIKARDARIKAKTEVMTDPSPSTGEGGQTTGNNEVGPTVGSDGNVGPTVGSDGNGEGGQTTGNNEVKGNNEKAKGCHFIKKLRKLFAAVRSREERPKVAQGRAPGLMLKLAREHKRMFSKN